MALKQLLGLALLAAPIWGKAFDNRPVLLTELEGEPTDGLAPCTRGGIARCTLVNVDLSAFAADSITFVEGALLTKRRTRYIANSIAYEYRVGICRC